MKKHGRKFEDAIQEMSSPELFNYMFSDNEVEEIYRIFKNLHLSTRASYNDVRDSVYHIMIDLGYELVEETP